MTNTTNPYQSTAQSSQKFSTLAIVGFVLAFVINIAGLVVSLIALSQIKRTGSAAVAWRSPVSSSPSCRSSSASSRRSRSSTRPRT